MTPEIIAETDAILAYHWLPDSGKLAHEPYTLVKVGQTLHVKTPIVLCENGLHASIKALDALHYAQGARIERVAIWGEVVRGEDKLSGEYRKCLAMADATRTLHEFAIWTATNALELAKVDDPRSWNALTVKQKWLDGQATDEELAAAWSAARAAAGAAAWSAAWSAAGAAARSAAGAAAWSAAGAAANSELETRLSAILNAAKKKTKHA